MSFLVDGILLLLGLSLLPILQWAMMLECRKWRLFCSLQNGVMDRKRMDSWRELDLCLNRGSLYRLLLMLLLNMRWVGGRMETRGIYVRWSDWNTLSHQMAHMWLQSWLFKLNCNSCIIQAGRLVIRISHLWLRLLLWPEIHNLLSWHWWSLSLGLLFGHVIIEYEMIAEQRLTGEILTHGLTVHELGIVLISIHSVSIRENHVLREENLLLLLVRVCLHLAESLNALIWDRGFAHWRLSNLELRARCVIGVVANLNLEVIHH